MNVRLPFDGPAFYKVFLGACLLALATVFPVASYAIFAVMIVGRAHSIGAWVGMWRAGKFTWPLILWGVFVVVCTSFLGFRVLPIEMFGLVAFCLFAFHFVYDEFELEEVRWRMQNILAAAAPLTLSLLYLLSSGLGVSVPLKSFVLLAAALLMAEVLVVKEVGWFFVRMKLLTLFILFAVATGMSAAAVMFVFLIDHYLFWFAYPVYRLHKYAPKERDGFVMLLLVIVVLATFTSSGFPWVSAIEVSPAEVATATKVFFTATIAHILTTPPFAYLFGAAPSKHHGAAE